MYDNYRYIDIIERASDRRPLCECGRPTEPVYRDGAIWLECSSMREPHRSRMAKLMNALTIVAHVHERIVDLPPQESLPSAA